MALVDDVIDPADTRARLSSAIPSYAASTPTCPVASVKPIAVNPVQIRRGKPDDVVAL
ncbi:MAG TPA: hypothetical protein VFW65_03370 [Pseudonocardiaceae bacterium]|nr:hypothetical protein [Pseudonocardiaceae bacterium]